MLVVVFLDHFNFAQKVTITTTINMYYGKSYMKVELKLLTMSSV